MCTASRKRCTLIEKRVAEMKMCTASRRRYTLIEMCIAKMKMCTASRRRCTLIEKCVAEMKMCTASRRRCTLIEKCVAEMKMCTASRRRGPCQMIWFECCLVGFLLGLRLLSVAYFAGASHRLGEDAPCQPRVLRMLLNVAVGQCCCGLGQPLHCDSPCWRESENYGCLLLR
ncbi:hypothetical protein CRG98_039100 [Punica granatum]|uniref:Uncharacterized protein n=1 Tax=Punica granatum TaxID=22663 RepID=A0A2I0I932_PUNGR|nr:hypothetical protein CRG98_039100 [Punica granatum]